MLKTENQASGNLASVPSTHLLEDQKPGLISDMHDITGQLNHLGSECSELLKMIKENFGPEGGETPVEGTNDVGINGGDSKVKKIIKEINFMINDCKEMVQECRKILPL